MSDLELPTVITAISNPEIEGFIAGALFAQGWSVIFRAIDRESLENYSRLNPENSSAAILIYSPDLSGLTPSHVESISRTVKALVGFAREPENVDGYRDLHAIPTTTTDLVSLVRGFVRAPMIRQNTQVARNSRRAHVVAIGSAGSGTGCTTLALNLAMELSVLEKSTLLIDANFRAPSVAALLAVRHVQSETGWRTLAPGLCVAEISQDQAISIDSYMERATANFDNIIIDLGSISGLSHRLTDRRWTSTMTTWCCDQGDEIMIVARADLLGIHRLEQVVSLLGMTSIRSAISFILNMRSQGRKGEEEEGKFLSITTPLRPTSVRVINRDLRAATAAQAEKATFIEVNERSALRKSIARIASEMIA